MEEGSSWWSVNGSINVFQIQPLFLGTACFVLFFICEAWVWSHINSRFRLRLFYFWSCVASGMLAPTTPLCRRMRTISAEITYQASVRGVCQVPPLVCGITQMQSLCPCPPISIWVSSEEPAHKIETFNLSSSLVWWPSSHQHPHVEEQVLATYNLGHGISVKVSMIWLRGIITLL